MIQDPVYDMSTPLAVGQPRSWLGSPWRWECTTCRSLGWYTATLRRGACSVKQSSDPWTYKIADFGLAHRMQGGAPDSHYSQQSDLEACLTRRYSAASEVFSFGVVLREVFAEGALPYEMMGGSLSR